MSFLSFRRALLCNADPALEIAMPGPSRDETKSRTPSPRYRIAPPFARAIRASGEPIHKLADAAGFSHSVTFSTLLHQVFVGTPLVVERLERVATIIGFPPSEMFIPAPPAWDGRVPARGWAKVEDDL